MINFNNKITLVAGGNSGLGFEIVKEFLKQDSKIIILGRTNKKNINAVKQLTTEFNNQIIKSYNCNLSIEDDLLRTMKMIKKKYGKIDYFINCVGKLNTYSISKLNKSRIYDLHDNNLLPIIIGCKILPQFMNKGAIVNFASFAAFMPFREGSLYAAYKAAAINFTKSAAFELNKKGIRVNIVTPGLIDTPINAARIKKNKSNLIKSITMNKIGKPSDVSGIVLFLCSEYAKYITGENFVVSGGKYLVQE